MSAINNIYIHMYGGMSAIDNIHMYMLSVADMPPHHGQVIAKNNF